MRFRLFLYALVFLIGALGTGLYATSWTYDFGTESTTHSSGTSTTFIPNPPALSGTHMVAVGTGGGGGAIYRVDPGLATFGTGTELRIQAPTTTGSNGINKYSVYDYDSSSNLSRTGYMRTFFRLGNSTGGNADSGTFYFFWGDGDTNQPNPNDPYMVNNIIGTDQAFLGMRFVLGPSGTVTTSWMIDNAWTAFNGYTFQQGQNYMLEFFASNGNGTQSNTYICHGASNIVTTPAIDVWVNGALVGNELANAWKLDKNKEFDSFMWYGEGSVGNVANLFLDSMAWSNNLSTSSYAPTYTEFYSKTKGNLDVLSSWSSAPNDFGVAPTSFAAPGQTFYIWKNGTTDTFSIGDNWTVSGTNSKVILGDGTNAVTLTVPSTYALTGTTNVGDSSTLRLENTTLPTLGTLGANSIVIYAAPGNQNVAAGAYQYIQILGSGTKTLIGDVTAVYTTTVGDGSNLVTLLIPSTYSFTGTISVANKGILDIASTVLPKIGALDVGSTVRYTYPGEQPVIGGVTYYNLEIAAGTDKVMQNNVTVTNLMFNASGTLALNNYNLYFTNKPISFSSTNAVFSSLSVNYTDAFVGGEGVGRIWDTEGSFTNTVDVTFTFPYTPPVPLQPLFLWYKDGSTWIKGASYTPTMNGGNATITVTGLSSLLGGAKAPKSWTFAEGDETLPVELSSFTAMISSTNYVQLTWITQSETNVAGFRIYRNTTYDLATAEMLNTFVHATNTSQMQVYVYTDEEIQQNGTYYYWLQNLDLDGSFTFHGPTTITITGHEPGIPPVPVVLGINNAWPNPFNPTLTIKYGMTKSGNAALDIYNQRGQLVRNLMSGARESGSYSQVWDGRDNSGRELPSGVYFIRLQASGKTFGHKVVLLK